ncbi:2,3-diketo-5-methylthiopentyl-1-phosphate enolase [Alicyclobacillus fastidiosus]|uniref:2,3-diketo-5-methylthiopentyl-1-phosphate enolase n=1 Tax=Alicyclobacillus fastidiosus TaxID=392011 RepID=A0ABY6ZGY9_9BACL|nr:2,3-diketo-5-methylthiopentyl-1-phosphate enolase [Alicyclobacillus fastidiosus]WAH42165.1 2,3-diketo-5-methylthiopentyl-1-phosphate enolase [Alicyclobacillus fastidiosus]GMA63957.1 2,3-diketo-5-methylthiopentyl-1-phosphate enolase [Alicyclobacillus fastidiosus]
MIEPNAQMVIATYRVVDHQKALEKRAEGIAIGLTIGSWTELPQTRHQQVSAHCGQVQGIRVVEEVADGRVVAEISVGYPQANFNGTFAALLTTVFGKLSMDGEIRLVRLQIPDELARQYPGPKFGVSGCRSRYGVVERPLIMSIFKACVGLTLPELVSQFEEQALGGVDLVKDDEIFFTEAYATPESRVVAYREAARAIAERTGRETAYAVNLTGPVHQLRERARRLSELGAGALLVNIVAYGYDVVADLAADEDVNVPILAHPAVSGALYGGNTYGVEADIVLGQLARMAGADMAIFPSMYGSVTLGQTATERLIAHLRSDTVHKPSLPAPSAGIYPGLVPQLYADFGNDLIVNAGGGIHGHPQGPAAGGQAFVEAIRAVRSGSTLSEAAKHSEVLRIALQKWGTRD